MNIVLDTLASARSARWVGHAAGLAAFVAFTALGPGGQMAWMAALQMGLALFLVEGAFSLLDFKARRLRALAPTAFPFKKLEPAERALVQEALGSLPARGALRAAAAWVLGGFALTRLGVRPEGAALLLACGLPLAVALRGWLDAAMLKRVLPFFYFEDQGGYARGLAAWVPGLGTRLARLALAPLAVALTPLGVLAAFGEAPSLALWGLQAGLGLATAWAGRAALASLYADPLRDLGSALQRLGQGGLDGLLDVTDGGELGRATEAYNRALRAVDRRLFMLEKFGHAVPPGRSEGVLEGLKLDGEVRPVAVLAARWLRAPAALRGLEPRARLAALSRFYEAVQDAVDRHQGCAFKMDDAAALAVWGAPFGPEGAVAGALAAAWDLQALLPVLARQAAQRDGLALEWGLGLASGQAVAGLAGPRGRERYGVHGGPVDEAQALAAKPGGAWLDERTVAAAKAPFGVQVGVEGARLVQGPSASMPTEEALGFRPGERLQAF